MSLLLGTPPKLEVRLRAEAAREGISPEEYAFRLIERSWNDHQAAEEIGNAAVAEPDSDEWALLSRNFGAWKSGGPNSADNERIDADIEQAYAETL